MSTHIRLFYSKRLLWLYGISTILGYLMLILFINIQWNLDLRKPCEKNSEYEKGFEEISVLFNEKIFRIRKRK